VHDSAAYRIEKTRLAMSVRLRSGLVIDGFVFLQTTPYGGRQGGEEPADMLNGSEPFFPLESHRGETLLIAKDQVLEAIADIPLAIDELRRATARSADVEVTLEDGSQRRGTVFIELPHERPRVLDFLNSAADRFVTLYAGGTATLINGQAIACVHPLD
jgi:hypothetical protein